MLQFFLVHALSEKYCVYLLDQKCPDDAVNFSDINSFYTYNNFPDSVSLEIINDISCPLRFDFSKCNQSIKELSINGSNESDIIIDKGFLNLTLINIYNLTVNARDAFKSISLSNFNSTITFGENVDFSDWTKLKLSNSFANVTIPSLELKKEILSEIKNISFSVNDLTLNDNFLVTASPIQIKRNLNLIHFYYNITGDLFNFEESEININYQVSLKDIHPDQIIDLQNKSKVNFIICISENDTNEAINQKIVDLVKLDNFNQSEINVKFSDKNADGYKGDKTLAQSNRSNETIYLDYETFPFQINLFICLFKGTNNANKCDKYPNTTFDINTSDFNESKWKNYINEIFTKTLTFMIEDPVDKLDLTSLENKYKFKEIKFGSSSSDQKTLNIFGKNQEFLYLSFCSNFNISINNNDNIPFKFLLFNKSSTLQNDINPSKILVTDPELFKEEKRSYIIFKTGVVDLSKIDENCSIILCSNDNDWHTIKNKPTQDHEVNICHWKEGKWPDKELTDKYNFYIDESFEKNLNKAYIKLEKLEELYLDGLKSNYFPFKLENKKVRINMDNSSSPIKFESLSLPSLNIQSNSDLNLSTDKLTINGDSDNFAMDGGNFIIQNLDIKDMPNSLSFKNFLFLNQSELELKHTKFEMKNSRKLNITKFIIEYDIDNPTSLDLTSGEETNINIDFKIAQKDKRSDWPKNITPFNLNNVIIKDLDYLSESYYFLMPLPKQKTNDNCSYVLTNNNNQQFFERQCEIIPTPFTKGKAFIAIITVIAVIVAVAIGFVIIIIINKKRKAEKELTSDLLTTKELQV